jgi:hypothetical protein
MPGPPVNLPPAFWTNPFASEHGAGEWMERPESYLDHHVRINLEELGLSRVIVRGLGNGHVIPCGASPVIGAALSLQQASFLSIAQWRALRQLVERTGVEVEPYIGIWYAQDEAWMSGPDEWLDRHLGMQEVDPWICNLGARRVWCDNASHPQARAVVPKVVSWLRARACLLGVEAYDDRWPIRLAPGDHLLPIPALSSMRFLKGHDPQREWTGDHRTLLISHWDDSRDPPRWPEMAYEDVLEEVRARAKRGWSLGVTSHPWSKQAYLEVKRSLPRRLMGPR